MQLSMLLDMAADGYGDRVVVGRRADGLTAVQLRDLAAGGAAALTGAGADALVYLATAGPAFPVALFAAARAGVPLVPLNYRLGGEQLESLLSNHPGAYVIADPSYNDVAQARVTTVVTPEQWLATAKELANEGDVADTDAPAVLIYTSGTTSAPKGVLLRHHNLVSYVLGSVEFGSAEPEHAAIVCLPPYHIAAVANAITNLYAGRRCVTLPSFSPEEWLATVCEENVTNALVVPTMLARIMAADVDRAVPSLRTLAYGGAAMPLAVIERALAEWPQVAFANAYGLTETSSTIAVLGPEDHRLAFGADDATMRARLGSVGRPLPGVDIEIRDADGAGVPPGQVGRIWVRGEQVSGEYAGSGPMVDAAGFFDTRDEGYFDESGYLFVKGRADDTIIRGGENIAPAEIEDVLLRHECVADVAVLGVPDEEWGQRIEAVCVLRPGAETDGESLRAYVRSLLRSSKTPDRIVFWPELPRTETGKLIRRDLVERLRAVPHAE
ncbi:MAG: class I adenylate-forming enzyme family protein [Actinomycetes bacterium]